MAAAGGVTMLYRWDAGWNMINEEDGNGTLMRTYWHHPQAGGRAALAHADGANPAQGAWGYYLHDHLGSTRRIHNHAKARIARFDYTPYGELFHAENPGVSTRRFTGHDWSAPAALYFAPYRYYNPSPARWLTRDPLGMVDGPNVYAYVKSSPIVQSDPLGLFPVFIPALSWKVILAAICFGLALAAPTATKATCRGKDRVHEKQLQLAGGRVRPRNYSDREFKQDVGICGCSAEINKNSSMRKPVLSDICTMILLIAVLSFFGKKRKKTIDIHMEQ